jgi:tetratricopeptide (TPR) repeat protein
MNSLAWLLATHKEDKLRGPEEAIRLAERACELTNYKDAGIVDTLAAAYASAGRFSDAAATAEKALKLIEPTGDTERAQNIKKRLQLYKRGQGYSQ